MNQDKFKAATEALRDDWGFSFVSFLITVPAGTRIKFDIEAKFFRVLWGDGSDDGRRSHKYQYEGEYRVEIIGRQFRMLDVSIGFVTYVDLKVCPCLEVLKCGHNDLYRLDVSVCKSLKVLNCHYSKLRKLILPEDSKLRCLDCSSNNLHELDLSGFTELEEVNACRNKIEYLNVEGCRKLIRLNAAFNNINCEGMNELWEKMEDIELPRRGILYINRNPGFSPELREKFLDKGWYLFFF